MSTFKNEPNDSYSTRRIPLAGITWSTLKEMVTLAESAYPNEQPMLLLGTPSGDAAAVVALPNTAQLAEKQWETSAIDTLRALDEHSDMLPVALVHTHCDAPPMLSEEDDAGMPMWMPAIVISVYEGRATWIVLFSPDMESSRHAWAENMEQDQEEFLSQGTELPPIQRTKPIAEA